MTIWSRSLLTPNEQRVLLWFCGILILGMSLQLFGFGREADQAMAADSLKTALEEDKQVQLDIRIAGAPELQTLPGIGEVRARAIIEYRSQHPFESVNQITRVRGIGPKTYEAILPYLLVFGDSSYVDSSRTASSAPRSTTTRTIASDTPVNINTASMEELCSLSGIGEVKARAIIAYREEHGAFGRVEDILKVSGIGPRTLEKNRERIRI